MLAQQYILLTDVSTVYIETGNSQNISPITHTTETDDIIYNLSGQPIKSPAKGLYIKNGRKYIK